MSKKSEQKQQAQRTLVGYCDECDREVRSTINTAGMAVGTMRGRVRCSGCSCPIHCSAAGQSRSQTVAVVFGDDGVRKIDQEMIA